MGNKALDTLAEIAKALPKPYRSSEISWDGIPPFPDSIVVPAVLIMDDSYGVGLDEFVGVQQMTAPSGALFGWAQQQGQKIADSVDKKILEALMEQYKNLKPNEN